MQVSNVKSQVGVKSLGGSLNQVTSQVSSLSGQIKSQVLYTKSQVATHI